MKQIAKEGIEWETDPDWGYDVPTDVPGVDLEKYTPNSYYSDSEYDALVDKLRGERREWLAKFPGLDPAIPQAVEKD
jgi:phosphoenolpyruvate carboxykinase (ATP)